MPTTLIAAFRSTLEETANVDVLIHVVDASNPDYLQHETTVISLLEELEMNHLPTLVIYNKMDHAPATFVPDQPESLLISALDQEAPDTIKQRMIQLIEKLGFLYDRTFRRERKRISTNKATSLGNETRIY